MPNYRLVLEYDGGAFEGWQLQVDGSRTVQGVLCDALEQITGERAVVTGSGRTDAGVHALGQVASVRLDKDLAGERLGRALNGVLPRDVGVRSVEIVPDDFDARRSALRKHYRYHVWNARERSPLREGRYAHVPRPLDLEAMRAAAPALLGEHDFSSFRAAGSDVQTSIRTVERLDLSGAPGGDILMDVVGTGFLRHMVRNIAGTLLEVGLGRRPVGSLGDLLAARDRRLAGPTAPASGLTLMSVTYSQPP